MVSWRHNAIGVGLLVIAAVLVWRIFDLQIGEGNFLQAQGNARSLRQEPIRAHRGMVTDRRGKPLAVSSPVGSVWANPEARALTGSQRLQLAQALGMKPEELASKLVPGDKFVYLRRHILPEQIERIAALDLPGIYIEREFKRFYPAGEVTAHVVGFTDIDDAGQEGAELAYDNWLKGVPGSKEVLKDLHGNIVKDLRPIRDAQPGRNLTLSLDLRVQYHAYRELKSAVHYYQAAAGCIVMLDAETGEVLAMVNQPSFNPNNRESMVDAGGLRNRTVTDVIEPGSTVKPFTVAVGLEQGLLEENTIIDTDPGWIRVGNKIVKDPSNRGKLVPAQILAKSSQVGITKIALSLEPQLIWSMFEQVGFGAPTGSGFPGERSGDLPNHAKWKPVERATFAYGYGLTVTPLQLATAYQVIASGGIRKPVSLLKADAEPGVRVMSKRVAQQLLEMLKQVVSDGTGTKARIESYTVAGKTGTVRKISLGGYQDTHHLTLFVGITPVERPRLVTVVMIDDPKVFQAGGGSVSAPLFSRVVAGALRLMNISPGEPV